MVDETGVKWEQFLNPAILRPRLIAASLFLAGFELLNASIVDRIRSFFRNGFSESGDILDSEYETDVLSRNRSPLYASLAWLLENKVIDDADLQAFEKIKACRNRVAHKLPNIIVGEGATEHLKIFPEMIRLLRKIEVWWVVNYELPLNPDFDHEEVDEDGIIPGPVITLKMMLDVALGSEEESSVYFKEWERLHSKP